MARFPAKLRMKLERPLRLPHLSMTNAVMQVLAKLLASRDRELLVRFV